MKVTFYHRRAVDGAFSIERVFEDIRNALPSKISFRVATSRYESRGFWRRLYNCIEAIFRQGDISHITGDIHYLAIFLRKRRTILTIHDCGSLRRLKGIRKRILYLFWYWLPVKRSAVITAISESTKREILNFLKCDPNKIRVIPDCVSPDFKRNPYVFNDEKPTILQIGTSPNKNLERVAEALKGIPCRLMIVGELSLTQKQILTECNIEYSSKANISDEELIEMYQQSDLVVFVSTYEGFGLPIIEAQAIGRPVVTSNIYSMPEVAGDGACLVNPFDVNSIRSGILRVIKNPDYRERLIACGLENVKRFTSTAIATQYVKIYEELLSNAL